MGLISGRKAFQKPMKDGMRCSTPSRTCTCRKKSRSHSVVSGFSRPFPQKLPQRIVGALKREFVPGDVARRTALECFVVARELSAGIFAT